MRNGSNGTEKEEKNQIGRRQITDTNDKSKREGKVALDKDTPPPKETIQ